MNSRPMILRFASGSVTPASAARKRSLGLDDLELDAGGLDEVPLDLVGLALAEEPVVDEHAGEAVTDGPLHEGGGHGGVDAARQPAHHPLVADRGRDLRDLLLDDAGHRPGGLQAGDVEEEVLEHGLALLGVEHLGVELHAGRPAGEVLEGGDLGAGRTGRDREALGGGGHRVAVAHPHRRRGREPAEQHRRRGRSPRAACGRTRRGRCAPPCRPWRAPGPGSRSRCRTWGRRR